MGSSSTVEIVDVDQVYHASVVARALTDNLRLRGSTPLISEFALLEFGEEYCVEVEVGLRDQAPTRTLEFCSTTDAVERTAEHPYRERTTVASCTEETGHHTTPSTKRERAPVGVCSAWPASPTRRGKY